MMFLRRESFREYIKQYPITSILIMVNLLMFVVVFLSGGSDVLIRFGALANFPPYSGELWRYVASMFLHFDFAHLLFNGFGIFIFAPALERLLGKVKYIILYFGSGIIGNLTILLLQAEGTMSAGASGAVYGLFGAYVYMILFRKDLIDVQSRKMIQIIIIIGIIYTLIMPGISIYGHFGGLIGGVLLLSLLKKDRKA